MYKKILVPLDGSKRAERILPHVENLAQCFTSTVVFLEVVSPMVYVLDPQISYADVNLEETQWRLDEARDYLAKLEKTYTDKGIAVKTRVTQGPVVETICEVAREQNVDLIALASHGRSGLGQVFFGSVAAGVLHRTQRPLLLIRSRDEG